MYAAIVIIIVALIIAIIAISRMKSPNAQAAKATAPEVMDGRKIRKVYGTVWVDDSMMLAWRPTGTIPIKAKSK